MCWEEDFLWCELMAQTEYIKQRSDPIPDS